METDVFGPLVEKLALETGETGEYFGEMGGQPAILTILSAQPPGVIVKIRVNSEKEHEIEVSEALFELAEKKAVNISVENGYGWLTFYDLSGFKTEEVIRLVDAFVQDIEEAGLALAVGCAICKSRAACEVYYSDGKVNRLCPECLSKRERQQSEKNKKLLTVKASSIWLILLGMTGFTALWVIMWLLYDYMFVLFRQDEIAVPHYILGGGGLVAIGILASTIGLPLRRFGIQKVRLLNAIASVLAVIAFIAGEIILAIIYTIKAAGAIVIVGSARYYIFAWQEQQPIFQVVKIGLVIGAIIGIHFIAKKKKAALEI
jgi:hypothetical protein